MITDALLNFVPIGSPLQLSPAAAVASPGYHRSVRRWSWRYPRRAFGALRLPRAKPRRCSVLPMRWVLAARGPS